MKWKAPATEPSPDCRPLHEVHATAKDDQGHAWSNGEYAARGRDGWDYAWACHPLPAPQPELTRTRVFSRLLHKRTMNMMPPCGGGFRHWGSSYPAAAIRSTAPDDFRQWTGVRQPEYGLPALKKIFSFPVAAAASRPVPASPYRAGRTAARRSLCPALPCPGRPPKTLTGNDKGALALPRPGTSAPERRRAQAAAQVSLTGKAGRPQTSSPPLATGTAVRRGLPSRPCVPHLAYWRHRHDAGAKTQGGHK